MRHASLFQIPLTIAVLGLSTTSCLLEPKGVGGDEPIDSGSGSDSETTDPTDGDPYANEIAIHWDGQWPVALARTPDGEFLAIVNSADLDVDGQRLVRFDEAGQQWAVELPLRADVLTVTDAGSIALGGVDYEPGESYYSVSYVWMRNLDGIELAAREVGTDTSYITTIDEAGGALWTMSHTGSSGGPAIWGSELCRHAADGAVEATYPFEELLEGMAVGPDGTVYTTSKGELNGELHRIAADGTMQWTVPLDVRPGLGTRVVSRTNHGVLVAHAQFPDLFVRGFDADGTSMGSFMVPNASPNAQPAVLDAGDWIALSYYDGTDGIIVEARAEDGAVQWTTTRSFPGAAEVNVKAVLALPSTVLVAGLWYPLAGGLPQGFVRFVPAP